MERDIKNKTIVITGGAGGIGYAIVDSFLKKGAKVVIILDMNKEQGNDAVKKLLNIHGDNRAFYLKCDVSKDLHDIFAKLLDIYGTIDVLVQCAGVSTGFQPLNESMNRKVIEINTTALILWTYRFWEHMRKDKGGKGGTIVNIASITGFRIHPFAPVYCASKFAVMGFSKSMGHKFNYDKSGVRVVTLCPGFTETPLVSNMEGLQVEQELIDNARERVKMIIWQKPEPVGKAAVDVFERAESGTAWVVEGGAPIEEVL